MDESGAENGGEVTEPGEPVSRPKQVGEDNGKGNAQKRWFYGALMWEGFIRFLCVISNAGDRFTQLCTLRRLDSPAVSDMSLS